MDRQTLHQMNLESVFGADPWDEEDRFLKDRAYRKRLFSKECREICGHVADVCDREEYDGSCIYDEYPDPIAVKRLVGKACGMCGPAGDTDMCRDMVTALMYDEICYRRKRRRDFKKRLYPG